MRVEAVVNTNGDTAVGTGFVVSKAIVRNGQTNRVSFLVTNKHMVGDWNGADGDISNFYGSLRLFCYSRTEPVILTNLQELVRWKHLLLHPEPKVDIAIVSVLNERVPLQGMSFDVSRLNAFSDTDPIGMGDQVFALGYPHGVRSLNNSYPIAKAGYVSSLTGEIFRTQLLVANRVGVHTQTEIQGKIFLVDGLLVPGNSGGPVMTPSETKVRNKPSFQTRQTENRVIGVMLQTAVEKCGGWRSKSETPSGAKETGFLRLGQAGDVRCELKVAGGRAASLQLAPSCGRSYVGLTSA